MPEQPAAPLTREQAISLTILGVDWGRKRIGLAIKPAGQDWVLPRTTLVTQGEAQAIAALRGAIGDSRVQAVVVGLPLNPDPAQAREIKRFCRKAREGMSGVRWFFIDESLTTGAAETITKEMSTRRPSDDVAAALILETFMQTCP